MSERSNLIHRLRESIDSRAAYIKAKLGILVPSQIRALRLRSDMQRQSDLARVAGLHQSRISMFETPGAANMTIETLSRLAAAFKVGLVVKFVPMSEMLEWENQYSQDRLDVLTLDNDMAFLDPTAYQMEQSRRLGGGASVAVSKASQGSQLVQWASSSLPDSLPHQEKGGVAAA